MDRPAAVTGLNAPASPANPARVTACTSLLPPATLDPPPMIPSMPRSTTPAQLGIANRVQNPLRSGFLSRLSGSPIDPPSPPPVKSTEGRLDRSDWLEVEVEEDQSKFDQQGAGDYDDHGEGKKLGEERERLDDTKPCSCPSCCGIFMLWKTCGSITRWPR